MSTGESSETARRLADLVHVGCVYVDGEFALRHEPEAHLPALEWALNERPEFAAAIELGLAVQDDTRLAQALWAIGVRTVGRARQFRVALGAKP